ncbi:hypothetical protein WUBG_05954, partial [Wuchereria bancrofti]
MTRNKSQYRIQQLKGAKANPLSPVFASQKSTAKAVPHYGDWMNEGYPKYLKTEDQGPSEIFMSLRLLIP